MKHLLRQLSAISRATGLLHFHSDLWKHFTFEKCLTFLQRTEADLSSLDKNQSLYFVMNQGEKIISQEGICCTIFIYFLL